MKIRIFPTPAAMGAAAGRQAAAGIRAAIVRQGAANVILATGASQFETLKALAAEQGIDWSRVTCFHLDEYAGMGVDHPASFRRYLKERFADLVPGLKVFHYVAGDAPDLAAECRRLGELIVGHPIDVACIGIGENGHLAFNDPPADFTTREPYLVVNLDEDCRRQQLGEGWFPTLADVPTRAISMSIHRIMQSAEVVCSVPDARKARAVLAAVTAPVSPRVPATILREHPNCTLLLDEPAAKLLPPESR